MFCNNCGEKLDEGTRFCTKCGTAVNAEAAPTVKEQVPSGDNAAKKKKALFSEISDWIALVLAVALVLFAGFKLNLFSMLPSGTLGTLIIVLIGVIIQRLLEWIIRKIMGKK